MRNPAPAVLETVIDSLPSTLGETTSDLRTTGHARPYAIDLFVKMATGRAHGQLSAAAARIPRDPI